MITKKINLNTRDIDNLIKSLTDLQSNISKLSKNISEKVAKEGLSTLNNYYASREITPNSTDISTSVEETRTGYKIIARGKDVIYTEFGTGDEGEQNPHPDKNKYNLNDYNSGKYIRDVSVLMDSIDRGLSSENEEVRSKAERKASKVSSSKLLNKYWTYKSADGEIQYTSGQPAGLQMFNTANDLRTKIIPKIIKEETGDVLSKL